MDATMDVDQSSNNPESEPSTERCAGCKKAYSWCWNDDQNSFPPIRILFLLGTCFFYIADVAIDVFTAIEHYLAWKQGNETAFAYFIATVVFIALPTVIINMISLGLYTWGYLVFMNERMHRHVLCGADMCTEMNLPDDTRLLNRKRTTKSSKKTTKTDSVRETSLKLGTNEPIAESIELDDIGDPLTRHRTLARDTSFSQWPPSYSTKKANVLTPTLEDETESDVESIDARFFSDEGEEAVDSIPEFYPLDLFFSHEYILVLFLHVLQLGFIFRVVRLLYRRKKDEYSYDRYRDVSFLRLIESFLESAPQLLLQLYIVVLEDIPDPVRKFVTGLAVIVSMVSLALAVADYISAGKDIFHYDPPPGKTRRPRLSWVAYFILIFCQLAMIISRGLAISLFASEYGNYVFIVGGIHYFVMVYWLYSQEAHLFKRKLSDYNIPGQNVCDNYGVEFIGAAFNLFFLFRLEEGSSFLFNTAYYTLFFIENLLMIMLWYVHIDYGLNLWYQEAAVVAVILAFVLGLSLLLLYYACFQPTQRMAPERDFLLTHPTMTCTLNRLYKQKITNRRSLQQYLLCNDCRK